MTNTDVKNEQVVGTNGGLKDPLTQTMPDTAIDFSSVFLKIVNILILSLKNVLKHMGGIWLDLYLCVCCYT